MRKFYFISACVLLALGGHQTFSQSGSQIFTASGVFTVPPGVDSVTIEVIGAGGTGGMNGGGGGGGGGYALGGYAVTPLSVMNVTVGTGGGGPSAGTTSVDALISASGGANGTTVANPNIGGGGAGGTGTGGTVANRAGGAGGGGYGTYFGGGGGGAAGSTGNGNIGGNTIPWTGMCLTPGGSAGIGGGTPAGNGGKGAGFTDAFCNVTDPAQAGANYGGGGGGGNGNNGPPASGCGGACIISWGIYVGMQNNAYSFELTAGPNPFTDKISIQYADGSEYYELRNSAGQQLWKGINIGQQDLSGLPAGLYQLKIMNGERVRTMKMVKL